MAAPFKPNPVLSAYSDQLVWVPVESSNLLEVAYQPDFRRLFVRFHKNKAMTAEWSYDDVTQAEYQALLDAPSHGVHFAAHIRNSKGQRRVR